MPIRSKELTQAEIKKLKDDGRHRVADNLYIRIRDGKRRWMCRLEHNKFVTMDGDAAYISKDDAKKWVISVLANPPQSKPKPGSKVAMSQMNFAQAADDYLERIKKGWKIEPGKSISKTEQNWRRCIDSYLGPAFGDKSVLELNANDCADALEPLWTDKYPTAKKFRQYMEKVILAAQVRAGQSPNSPCTHTTMKTLLGNPSHKIVSHEAPTVDQLKEFLATLDYSAISHHAMSWLIATVCRSAEARFASSDQINLDTNSWDFVPKMGEQFRVPLTKPMKDILKLQGDGQLFVNENTGKPLSDMALSKLVHDRGYKWVPHGVRACFTTWAEDEGVDHAVREMCLDHRKRGVEAAYARSDLLERRRVVMEQWTKMLFS
jgi:integrase